MNCPFSISKFHDFFLIILTLHKFFMGPENDFKKPSYIKKTKNTYFNPTYFWVGECCWPSVPLGAVGAGAVSDEPGVDLAVSSSDVTAGWDSGSLV